MPDAPLQHPLDLDLLAPEAMPGVRLLPVAHDRVESALVVRAVLAGLSARGEKPAAVAVELPTTLAAAVERAVARLPRVSVVFAEEPGEEALAWISAPGDPFAEALRWAAEGNRRRYFVDPDLPYAERHADPFPDPWAIWEIGPAAYFRLVAEAAGEGGEADAQRESGMAHHLQEARRELDEAGDSGPLVAVVGAAHLRGLAERLARPTAAPFARVGRRTAELRHLHPESLTGLLPDPPLAHAVFERLRGGSGGGEGGQDGKAEEPAPPLAATVARRLSLIRHGLTLHTREEEGWGSARRLRVVDYAAAVAGRRLGEVAGPDRRALGRAVWAVAVASWREQTREETAPWQRRLFFDYARRYTRTLGGLVPGLYEWVVAARGVGDDNLAWELFDAARAYPWQEEVAEDLETARLDGEDLDLGTRRVRFRRRFFRVKKRLMPVPVRERAGPENLDEWLEGFDAEGLCSYPPEDVVIEDYGRYLKKKAGGVVAAERERVEPFSTSLLDGVDVRETLRHVEDDRVWVREAGRAAGDAGAVVVIFDRDPGNLYPYLMTWLGEHHDESDMAFYSTQPADQVVGPGILRATYGGFVMTYPPGRLYDVWSDRDYRRLGAKPDVLLAAAVDYSEEKLVAHVAAQPPPAHLARHAAAQGKRIVHVPIGSLGPQALKKIRVLHILAGHDKRQIAAKYVW
ncbi:MAG TPA: hypothetical protein VKU40_16780 [Thermoanaerobaculia bacterium]|nr:hypothetical protein [Thermoanaerobaculia bacterium]